MLNDFHAHSFWIRNITIVWREICFSVIWFVGRHRIILFSLSKSLITLSQISRILFHSINLMIEISLILVNLLFQHRYLSISRHLISIPKPRTSTYLRQRFFNRSLRVTLRRTKFDLLSHLRFCFWSMLDMRTLSWL